MPSIITRGGGSALAFGFGAPPGVPQLLSSPALNTLSAVQNQTLSVSNGTWQSATSISYAYQWLRNGSNITGATSSNYTLTASDVGTYISCIVIATNLVGSYNAISNVTNLVLAPVTQGFLSTTTYTVPYTRTYTIYAVGGGAGSSGSFFYGDYYGAGGGSGYYAVALAALNSGDLLTINIGNGGSGGGNGGTTSVTSRLLGALVSANGGGIGGNSYGGSGGSGSGVPYSNSYGNPGAGGYNGSNGQTLGTPGSAGTGQTGKAYGLGNNTNIPPAGDSSYNGTNNAWSGIVGYGAGNQAGGNQGADNLSPMAAGGGAGGSSWAQAQHNGNSGLVVITG